MMATGGTDVVVTTGDNQEEEKEQERGEGKVCNSLITSTVDHFIYCS